MQVSSDYVSNIPEMTTFAVGEPFPFKNPNPGTEGGGLIHNTGFITLAMWSNQANDDAPIWQNEPAVVALWGFDYLPFLIAAFPQTDICIDYFFNALRMTETGFQEWLASEAQFVTLALIDERTNVLRAMRLVPIPPGMVERIKWTIKRNRELIPVERMDEMDRRASLIMSKVTTQQMLSDSMTHPEMFGVVGLSKRA